MIHHRSGGNPPPARRTRTVLVAALTAFLLALVAAIPAAAEQMRITFIRHGESEGNASGLIDTKVPGPVLTPLGHRQSEAIVGVLGDNNYDGIYASNMVRTQQTAAPMSQYLGLPIQILPGLREIGAGDYEGEPESEAQSRYLRAPLTWVGYIPSAPGADPLDARIPGGENGHEFDERVDDAIWTMYQNGDRNVAAFSHGGTIMFWVLMNTENSDPAWVFGSQWGPLHNTNYVVVEGDPETDEWRVVNWNGIQVAEYDPFRVVLFRQARTLNGQLNEAGQSVLNSLTTGDPFTIATAINRASTDAAFSIQKFGRAMNADMIDRVERAVDNPQSVLDEAQNSAQMLGAVAKSWVPAELSSAVPSGNALNSLAPATEGAEKSLRHRSPSRWRSCASSCSRQPRE